MKSIDFEDFPVSMGNEHELKGKEHDKQPVEVFDF